MKTKTLILAALALSAAVACNKENKENPVFEGDSAYISVNIAYSDASTKGESVTPPFYSGIVNENAVSEAHFFFYSADGTFATYASKAITMTEEVTPGTSTDKNVEEVGEAVVVLSGLKSTNYPAYMAVVLNPNGTMINDLKGKSISEAQAYVISAIATEGTSTTGPSTDWTNFVMTSSTFDNSDARTGYFCEKLVAENFQEDETTAKAHPVTAYVERLAAKVQLTLSAGATAKIGSFDVDGTAKDLYFNVLVWGLNATTKQSFTYKNINPSWAITGFDASKWNDATNHRSYWAKTPVYGVADGSTVTIGYSTPATETLFYPANYADVQRNIATKTPTLNFVSYNDLKVTVGNNAYCRENTNDQTVLRAVNFSAAATSVLLKARVQDAAGNPVQLVNYVKKLYTFDGYKNLVLTTYAANHAGALIVKYDGSTYSNIDKDDLEEVNTYDGYITLKLKALAAGSDYYFYDSGTSYTLTTADAATEALNGGAAAATPETKAEYYKDGMMYYNVPIEHLNNSGVKYGKTGFKTGIIEADYGVVRNHYYQVDITAIKNLGKAVYDPDEPIVPSDDDLKDYYVGAKINILSWKVVKQSVEL